MKEWIFVLPHQINIGIIPLKDIAQYIIQRNTC